MFPSGRSLYRTRLYTTLILILTGALALSTGCGKDKKQEPTGPAVTRAPEAWAGVWSVRTQVKQCSDGAALVDTTMIQIVCEGDSLTDILLEGGGALCAGGAFTGTATTSTYSCTQRIVDPDCSGTLKMNLTTTVNDAAGTSSGSGRIEFDADSSTAECPDFCFNITLAGTRQGPAPASCDSAAAISTGVIPASAAFGGASRGAAAARSAARNAWRLVLRKR